MKHLQLGIMLQGAMYNTMTSGSLAFCLETLQVASYFKFAESTT